MKFVALISGGKDSIFNIIKCIENGHELVCVANLHYKELGKENDSYMYQSVGSENIELIAECLDKPLFRREIKGKPVILNLEYTAQSSTQLKEDEVEDLFELLKDIKEKYPDVVGVSSGAIASTYQKLRVENCCDRLGMTSLAYLWDREQISLLQEMLDNQMKIMIIKTAAAGLDPRLHCGKTVDEIFGHLLEIHKKFGFNVCGEGGEYESMTLDCPIYKKRLEVKEFNLVMHSDDPINPVGYMKFTNVVAVDKKENEGKVKAIGVEKPGEAELLKELYFDRRPLGFRDIRVKVHAVSINPVDYKRRESAFLEPEKVSAQNPLVNGYDASGEVIALGAQAKNFKIGDQIYYSGNIVRKGANASEHVVDERICALKPKNLSYAEAASIPLVFGTAWEGLFDQMGIPEDPKVNENKTILVIAGAGGVGSAAIQLCKHILGLRVIATASREESTQYCKKMGADIVIDHRNSLSEQLKQHDITSVDYVINCYDMTPEYFNQIVDLIKPFGEICGIVGFDKPLDLSKLFQKALRLTQVFMGMRPVHQIDMEHQHQYFTKFAKWFEEKRLVPTASICEAFNVENLIKAHKKVESGSMIGKYVLDNVDKF